MPPHYTDITAAEMAQLLQPNKGWRMVTPSPAQEMHWDFPLKFRLPDFVKTMTPNADTIGHQLPTAMCIRVYSSITPDGLSRERGKDAIRVCIVANVGGKDIGLKGFSRVYRTQGWRDNLKERVMEAHEFSKTHIKYCRSCGSLMVIRKAKATKREFYGCLRYPACIATERL